MVTEKMVLAAEEVIRKWAAAKHVTAFVTNTEINEFAVELATVIDEAREEQT